MHILISPTVVNTVSSNNSQSK